MTTATFFDLRQTKNVPALNPLLAQASTLLFLWPIENQSPPAPHFFLSDKELEHFQKISLPQRKIQFLISRFYTKTLLATYLQISPSALEFDSKLEGKLILPKKYRSFGLDFNFSHTETLFLLGVSRTHDIGVDLEPEVKKTNQSQIADRILTDSEKKWIDYAADNIKVERFFRLWSSKEAIIKAAGGGVFRHVQDIHLQADSADALRITQLPEDFGSPEDWQLFEKREIQGFSCSWALRATTT